MLIAHLPAGYLLAKGKQWAARALRPSEMWAALLGALLPDIDMLWFWTVDHRQHHHHGYFTHWPSFWLLVWLVGVAAVKLRPNIVTPAAIHMFAAGALSHMVLDSVAAPIMWLAPVSYDWFELVHVPVSPNGALVALVTHWTFRLELAISLLGALVFLKSRFDRRSRRA